MENKEWTLSPDIHDERPVQYDRPTVISDFSVGVLAQSTPPFTSGRKRRLLSETEANEDVTVDEPAAKSRRVDNDNKTSDHIHPFKSRRRVLEEKSTHKKVYCSSKNRTYPIEKMDLNKGYSITVKRLDNEEEKLDILLEAIQKYNCDSTFGPTIVCYRGLLTKLASTLYEGKFDNGILVAIQKINNVIYMREFPTEAALENQANETDRQKLMQYWGHKFESYVTSDFATGKQSCDEPLNLNNEHCLFLRSKLGEHNLCFVGEVDCCFKENETKFIEIKTSRFIDHRNNRQMRSLCLFKFYKWWLQSYLIGIEDILCGFRDDDGFITELKWYKVSELPELTRQYGREAWSANVCMNTLDSIITFIKTKIESDTVYLLSRKPQSKRFLLQKDETKDHEFLPDWYLKNLPE